MAKQTVDAYVIGKHEPPYEWLKEHPPGTVVVKVGSLQWIWFDSEEEFLKEFEWV